MIAVMNHLHRYSKSWSDNDRRFYHLLGVWADFDGQEDIDSSKEYMVLK
jgi:hypothetical protein